MTLSRILPEFGAKPAQNTVAITDVSLEEQKLNSFEAGYRAGWDDSAAANTQAGQQVSADFAQNIGDLSMTYHEAYAALFGEIRPLLAQIVDSVLPKLAQETLAPRIVELIEAEISAVPRKRVVISAAAAECAFLQPAVGDLQAGLDVSVRADETMASGQIRLTFDDSHEQELDTAALVAGIQNAVHGFFQSHLTAAPDTDNLKETA